MLNFSTMYCIIHCFICIFVLSITWLTNIKKINMNNLIIAALTFVMLPALNNNTVSAKNSKLCKEAKSEFVFEKMNFTNDIINTLPSENNSVTKDEYTSVDVDYIIEENGHAYITYINAEDQKSKTEVVKFIESASYGHNMIPGKIYSMQLTLKK